MNEKITLESVKTEFKHWRENKHLQKGRKSIPSALWDKSIFLTTKHSTAKVSKYLNLSYSTLKQKIKEKHKDTSKECTFVKVDLDMPSMENETQYSIKAQNKNGETIEINASGIININDLLREFFRK